MTHFNKENEIYDLLIRFFENDINGEQQKKLLAWSQDSPNASKVYWDFAKDISIIRSQLAGQIQDEYEALDDTGFDQAIWTAMAEYEETAPLVKAASERSAKEPVKIVKVEGSQRVINKFSLYSAILSVAALFFVLLYIKLTPVNTRPAIGKLTRSVNAQWQDASGQIAQGCELYPGPVKLLSGLAEVDLDNGVKIIIEGPAAVEFESLEQFYLSLGNVVVNVSGSESKQFAIRLNNCSIVDYGTEFGASVSRDGQVRVDVFEGMVSLRDSFNPLKFNESLLLKKGERGEVSRDGQLSKAKYETSSFIRKDEFDINTIAPRNSYYRWKAYNYKLHRDPALVAHYTFEQDNDKPNTLINSAPLTTGLMNGVLGGASSVESAFGNNRPEWIVGRWPNKTALSFSENRDSKVVIPSAEALQLTGPITLCAWINFSGENTGGAIIDCRDGYKINYHLYLHKDSNVETMELRRYYGTTLDNRNWSVDFEIPKNTWCMVSATHDSKVVRYYLNGDLVGTVPYEYQPPQPVRGDLVIGNALFPWASPFKNEIGEIAILKRAMSSNEIREMYAAGRSQ